MEGKSEHAEIAEDAECAFSSEKSMNAPPHNEQCVIRVFVSSTFRDMQAERDELVPRRFSRMKKSGRPRRASVYKRS